MRPAQISRYSLLLLSIFLMAVWLPEAKNKLFEYRFGKTHMFYSPVEKTFIYKELLGEGHQFVYRDREGNDYTREEFESRIPFIYYKNMEIWGKLPLEINGQSFDKKLIKAERQVMQLKAEELPEHSPRIELYPLLESNPGRARLRFPENVFRPGDQLSFIDSDHNRPNPELTAPYTEALQQQGFEFPIHATYGRVSILKPYDAGYFLLDARGGLYHLLRKDGEPQVTAVPLPEGLQVRHIKMTESKRKETIGLLLDQQDKLNMIGYGSYRLIPLELPGYEPDTMEIKIIFNPLYRTAIYSDNETITTVVMDKEYTVIDSYSRVMAMAAPRLSDQIWQALSPVSLELRNPDSRYISLKPVWHGWYALIGSLLSLVLVIISMKVRGHNLRSYPVDLILVFVTGVYGLLALLLLPPDE